MADRQTWLKSDRNNRALTSVDNITDLAKYIPPQPSGDINPLNLNNMRFQNNSRKYLSNCGLIQPL